MAAAARPRQVRADAVRNRQLLLDTAAAAFAEHGIEVSIAEIAQRAGVGKGTVFRHFATKEDLIAAIVGDQLDHLSEAGISLLGSADPTAALVEFMTLGVDLQSRDRSLCQMAIGVVHNDPEIKAASDRLDRVAEALTQRAHRHGGIRKDVTGQDILLLLRGAHQAAAPLAQVAPELGRRYLAIIVDGLRPAMASPLPGPIPGPSFSISTTSSTMTGADPTRDVV